jgi:hypothetical protein
MSNLNDSVDMNPKKFFGSKGGGGEAISPNENNIKFFNDNKLSCIKENQVFLTENNINMNNLENEETGKSMKNEKKSEDEGSSRMSSR